MSTAVIWSQSKPEVEIQYGGFLANSMACHPSATLFSEVARRLWLSSLVLCLKVLFWGRVYLSYTRRTLYTADLADVVKTSLSSFLACNSRLRGAIRRHHPPQRAVLSQICCFGERKMVMFHILLAGAEPRDAGTTQLSSPVCRRGGQQDPLGICVVIHAHNMPK